MTLTFDLEDVSRSREPLRYIWRWMSRKPWEIEAWFRPPIGNDMDWIGLCSVLRPLQHSIGYMGDGFYRSKDPTNSIEVLKENLQKTNQTTETTQNRHA